MRSCPAPALLLLAATLTALPAAGPSGGAKTLEQELLAEGPAALAKAARAAGDPVRGAVLFHSAELACAKCHDPAGRQPRLGPDLTAPAERLTAEHLVESVLDPSKVIRTGYESVTVTTVDGVTITGLLAERGPDKLVLRDAARDFTPVTIPAKDVAAQRTSKVSPMPAGQANQLVTRQQFLDLARYLIEVNDKGAARAAELRPAASPQVSAPLPDYEKDIDHAGLIADLDGGSLKRGGEVYARVCANCHGTKDQPGSMPTSLRFAEGSFKNGADPYSLYRTLTHGFGLMPQQTLLVPRQKYDVIHYVRETYLKPHNRSQYAAVDEQYLGRLPKGKGRGPAPSAIQPWVAMDYGPVLNNTYEIGRAGDNFAHKGIAVRLDDGPGGVSRGRVWTAYDHDTMRAAAGWTGTGFIDWEGIHFDGRHQAHPHVAGQVHWTTPAGPGWANPQDGTFADPRLKGLDGKHYGPLPREWLHYKGQYRFGGQVVLAYSVGTADVLEMAGLAATDPAPVFTRTFNIGPREKEMVLRVARHPGAMPPLETRTDPRAGLVAVMGGGDDAAPAPKPAGLRFDGATRVEPAKPEDFDLIGKDYTIAARIKTKQGGTIFAKTAPGSEWVPDGKALFVRGGKLVYDIGWVGAVTGRTAVADDKWHDVAVTWDQKTGKVTLFVDGKADRTGTLKPKKPATGQVVRIGFAAPNFPDPSAFRGDLAGVRFYQRALSAEELAAAFDDLPADKALVARWKLDDVKGDTAADATKQGHDARVVTGEATAAATTPGVLVAGASPAQRGVEWVAGPDGELRLKVPAGKEPLKFTVWLAGAETKAAANDVVAAVPAEGTGLDLAPFTRGGAPRWAGLLRTPVVRGDESGPFAVDTLTPPMSNPWACQIRPSGLDFLPDGKRMAVCTWDGDVWLVSGIGGPELTWQRIASGLFQPLGLKVVGGNIYVGCRDQIVILRDLNGDGETDFYENFNSDHQVTEHFHEFAMGLQTDAAGNFYYAKAARHAKTPLVPHHGTLLRVAKDGSRTDILATGFRAPNGVCVNPDGTFYLTDQEGHWTPKNRINHVKEGGFYGNMWGYTDRKDTSDVAMELPLCWITNRFDRSPSELLWVPKDAWGTLGGSLLNLSYGYGKVFVVPHETVNGRTQGGMSPLPIPQFPTGVMRGRFHPADGHLYLCGMHAWGGNQQQPGGLYRVRHTGKPVWAPVGLNARAGEVAVTFSGKLDSKVAADAANYTVTVWDLKRGANYGSNHLNERKLRVSKATVSADGKTVVLHLPDLNPTWGMEVTYAIRGDTGAEVSGSIHNSVYELPK